MVFFVSATVSINHLSRGHDHPLSIPSTVCSCRVSSPSRVGLGCFSRLFWSIVSLLRAALLLLGCGVKAHLRGDAGCCTTPPLHRSSLSLVKAPCPCSGPHGPPKCHRFLVFRVPRRSRHRCGQHPRTDRLAVRCLQNCSPHPAPQGICLLKFLCSVSHSLSSAAVPTRGAHSAAFGSPRWSAHRTWRRAWTARSPVASFASCGWHVPGSRISSLAYCFCGSLLPMGGPATGVLADCLTL